jgi:hypothetical protein
VDEVVREVEVIIRREVHGSGMVQERGYCRTVSGGEAKRCRQMMM